MSVVRLLGIGGYDQQTLCTRGRYVQKAALLGLRMSPFLSLEGRLGLVVPPEGCVGDAFVVSFSLNHGRDNFVLLAAKVEHRRRGIPTRIRVRQEDDGRLQPLRLMHVHHSNGVPRSRLKRHGVQGLITIPYPLKFFLNFSPSIPLRPKVLYVADNAKHCPRS